jgi:hypothetical protein
VYALFYIYQMFIMAGLMRRFGLPNGGTFFRELTPRILDANSLASASGLTLSICFHAVLSNEFTDSSSAVVLIGLQGVIEWMRYKIVI